MFVNQSHFYISILLGTLAFTANVLKTLHKNMAKKHKKQYVDEILSKQQKHAREELSPTKKLKILLQNIDEITLKSAVKYTHVCFLIEKLKKHTHKFKSLCFCLNFAPQNIKYYYSNKLNTSPNVRLLQINPTSIEIKRLHNSLQISRL